MKTLIGFSIEKLDKIFPDEPNAIFLNLNLCSENQKRLCEKMKKCSDYFPQGTKWQDEKLGELLKRKNFNSKTDKQRDKLMAKFERKVFKNCRKFQVEVKEIMKGV